jgi:arylsulfatase A-like enzyme
MRHFLWMSCAAALAGTTLLAQSVRAQAPRPNIVHIYADDLGWGSVGFNGQTQIATPNLDALANAGMRLNNAYAATVCSASRGSFYTGFHSGHANIDGNSELTQGFAGNEIMTPQVLDAARYKSAIFGKWGFGATGGTSNPVVDAPASLPTNHGFDEFYGYLNHGAAQNYFYPFMFQSVANANPNLPPNIVRVSNSQYSHDVFAQKSEQFVAAHAGDDDPFYLEVAYTIPHYDIDAIASAPGGYGQYAAMPWTNQQKAYAAMITRMDTSIGALMDRLDDPNGDNNNSDSILDNTLVIFTSDNGPTVDDATPMDFFDANGIYRGGKFELFEGGIHVPGVAYWRNTIAPGTSTSYRTDLADFMATAADLAGVEAPVGIDGTSIAPILTGEGRMRERDYLVFEHQGSGGADPETRITRWAVIRQDGKKLIRYDNETSALYDLATDPDESSPLSLAGNAALVAELEGYAIAEGATRGIVQYRTWSGTSGGDLDDAAGWSSPTGPDCFWSAVVLNASGGPRIAHVSTSVSTLGIEVRGDTSKQVVEVHAGKSLSGRNEVRVGANGRIDLDGGTLATNRWVNVRANGEVRGQGTVEGDVYNEGVLSPGRNDDLPAWPIAAPPALPPVNLNTAYSTAVNFNFAGVQDDVPVGQTSTISPYLEVTHGLDFGPSVGPRWGSGGTDAGNELNVIGHTATSLNAAKANGDFITFTIDPIDGAGIVPSSVSFRVWRNGTSAAPNFAILSSVDGFTNALAQATYNDTGVAAQHTLTANVPAISDANAITAPIEYRLYAWGATSAVGGTHVNLASLNAKFVAVPTLEFNFTGVQDGAPLTSLRRSNANVSLTGGFDFGPGVAPRGANNAGNEFHVAGFSTGTTLQSALTGNDYLTFSVQPIAGMAMYPNSVSFTLWRESAGSAADYALFSSVGGFNDGAQLTQAHVSSTGVGNQQTLTGSFVGAQPTTSPVELRIYGWNAATSLDSTHLVAASMRARFASVSGTPIDPTGLLTVQGDLYHLVGGTIDINLGGTVAGVSYDSINVVGDVELEGNLVVSLADVGGSPFAPTLNNAFDILTATQISGEFANVTLPTLSWQFDWQVDYLTDAVRLVVVSTGDFNDDGLVDAADYIVWRKFGGTEAEYSIWQENYGKTINGGTGAQSGDSIGGNVPEPTSAMLILAAVTMSVLRRQPRIIDARNCD